MNKKATKYTAFFVLGLLAVIAVFGLVVMISTNNNVTGLNSYFFNNANTYGGGSNALISGQAYFSPVPERTRNFKRSYLQMVL